MRRVAAAIPALTKGLQVRQRSDWLAFRPAIPQTLAIVAACSVQAALLVVNSLHETATFSLTWDFANAYQAAFLISHGDFDPFVTGLGTTWLGDHFDVMLLPIGLLQALWASPLVLKLIQDAAVVLTTWAAYAWISEIVRDRSSISKQTGAWICGASLTLLTLNPWPYWSNAFDFHIYPVATLFLVLSGRALYSRRLLPAIGWALACASCGSVCATLVVATGASFAVGKRARRAALGVMAVGLATVFATSFLHLDRGDQLSSNFGYLLGPNQSATTFDVALAIVRHPDIVFARFWEQRGAIYANLATTGFIGVLAPFAAGPVALVLAENVLGSGTRAFAGPGGQNAPIYPFLAVGFAWVCTRLQWRSPAVMRVALVLAVANACGWFVAWYPRIGGRWYELSPPETRALFTVSAHIQPADEVIASQGIVGAFAARRSVYPIFGGDALPLRERRNVAIVSTGRGIEVASLEQRYAAVATLLALPYGSRILAGESLWAFALSGPRAAPLRLPASANSLPAVVFPSDVGRAVFAPHGGAVVASGRAGNLVRNAVWRRPAGHYTAQVWTAGGQPYEFEALDADDGRSLAVVPSSAAHVSLRFALAARSPAGRWVGDGLFGYRAGPRPQALSGVELRVVVPAGSRARVLAVGIRPGAG